MKHIRKHLMGTVFLAILGLKIIASFFFASDVMVNGFAPFLNFFVESGFQNPYDHFLAEGALKAFPYGSVMLWILALPRALFSFLLSGGVGDVSTLHLFIMRIPVLLADIVIYLILCAWLPSREKKVTILYWASPILFYINYFHGQLDVIPTAILFISLAALFTKRTLLAYVLLGVGIATKSHLVAALPFYLVYSLISKFSFARIASFGLAALAAAALLILPYAFSPGFQTLVLHAQEQGWVFLLSVPYPNRGVTLLLAPMMYLLLLFHFISHRKVTDDLFILMLACVFASLVILVPPMPGWLYWSVPLLVYFYGKKQDAPVFNFVLLTAFSLLYFVLQSDSAPMLSSLMFTAFEASLVLNVLWCYKVGIHDNFVYRKKTKPLLIGIGGDSGAGKSRLAGLLAQFFHEKNVVCIRGDDAHRWPRGDQHWEVFTHLNPKSNKLHQESQYAVALKSGHPIERVTYDHTTGTFTNPVRIASNKVIIFEGLHTYSLKRTRDLFDLKIFVEPEEALRVHWKIERDTSERGYSAEKVLNQLSERQEDSEKFIKPQKELADIVIGYELNDDSIRLRITVDTSLDSETFVQALATLSGASLEIAHSYENLDTVSIACSGKVSSQDVERAAYALIPNLKELAEGTPVWSSHLDGVVELFIVYYLSQKLISKQEMRHE